MNFALKLKELRDSKNISQAKLAYELGVSIGCVGMWESTKQIPPATRLVQIADYFGVTVDYLLGREDKKNLLAYEHHEITDKQTLDIMKLFKVMTEIQKAQVIGYVIGMLENAGVNVKTVLGY